MPSLPPQGATTDSKQQNLQILCDSSLHLRIRRLGINHLNFQHITDNLVSPSQCSSSSNSTTTLRTAGSKTSSCSLEPEPDILSRHKNSSVQIPRVVFGIWAHGVPSVHTILLIPTYATPWFRLHCSGTNVTPGLWEIQYEVDSRFGDSKTAFGSLLVGLSSCATYTCLYVEVAPPFVGEYGGRLATSGSPCLLGFRPCSSAELLPCTSSSSSSSLESTSI
jgi:hypothetical protein